MYKLICIDMDGTLLDTKKQISNANKQALKAAHDKGVHIVITTGRIYCNAAYYSNLIEVNSPVIAANGALIKEKNKTEPIYKCVIPERLNMDILRLCNKYKVSPNFVATRDLYCGTLRMGYGVYYFVYKTKMKESNVKIHIVKGKRNWDNVIKKQADEIIKCEIYDNNISKIKSIKKDLEALGELEVFSAGETGLDITSRHVSKGTALKFLAQHYNINEDEIIAIGDSDNDIDMIESAGLGVAMGNAIEAAKKNADYITSTNDQDGVAQVINKFVICTPEGV